MSDMSFRTLKKFVSAKNKNAKANFYFAKAKKWENLKKKSENISNFKKFFFKFWAEQIFLKIIIQRLDFAFSRLYFCHRNNDGDS